METNSKYRGHINNSISCSVFVFSMLAYQRRSQEEEKKTRLEQRRNRLREMLQEEGQRYEAELKELTADRRPLQGQQPQEIVAIRFAGGDRKVCHLSALLKRCIVLSA